jgi:hypothetical protein
MKTCKRNWDALHNFESRMRVRYLKQMSFMDNFKIQSSLFWLAYLLNKAAFRRPNFQKIKTLSRVHSIFNNVKPHKYI